MVCKFCFPNAVSKLQVLCEKKVLLAAIDTHPNI